jgi:subtilase family serine protease
LPPYPSVCTGSPGQCPLTVVLNGPDPGLVSGDETEADLDVEWAGAVAPGATIDFVVTESTQTDGTDGVDASAMYVVDNNIAPILSESFGSCESNLGTGGNAFFNSLWQQAAAQGITVVVAAGDNGSAACDPASANVNQDAAASGLAISGIASTPFNTALGGTDFDDVSAQSTFWNTTNTSTTPTPVLASAKGYIPERTWNDSCAAAGTTTGCTAAIVNANNTAAIANGGPGIDLGAGSGGSSTVYTGALGLKPTWQTGFGDANRDIPDVSLFSSDNGSQTAAANSFYIICESDQDPTGGAGCNLTTSAGLKTHDFLAVGGTSAATPTFAAIMSLVIQQQAGQRQGVANPVLYSLAKTAANVCNSSSFTAPSTSNTCVFYDVTKGNNSVACVGGSPNCSNKTAGQFGIMATAAGGTTPAFSATTGYDLATGLGTVNVTNLIAKWASPALNGTTITLAGPTSPAFGASSTFTGTVTKTAGAATPTGLVLLEDMTTGVVVTSTNLPANGNYSVTTTLLPAAATAYNLIAHYGGDGNFSGSNSAALSMNVPKQNSQVLVDFLTTNANGVTTANTSSATVSYGSDYIMRVDVTNTSGTPCQNASNVITFACPTGSIQLFNGTTPLNDFPMAQNVNATNAARLNDRGFAEDQPIQLSAGSYKLNATYTADANSSFNSSTTSNTVAVTITQATTSTSLAPPNPASIASGGSVTLTATVTATSNGEPPCGSGAASPGTVQFKNGGTAISGTVSYTGTSGAQNGQASCTATLTTALSQFIPLRRPQPPLRIPAMPLWIVTILAILILALAQHAARLQQRWPRLGKRLGYAAAGLLLFTCLAAGFAGCSGSSRSSGTGGGGGTHTDSITAVYSGDANYTTSTSTAVSVTVQ